MFWKILKWVWRNKLSEEERERIIKFLENPKIAPIFRNLVSILKSNIVEVRGSKMYLDPKRNPEHIFYDIGGYESVETELFERCIKEGDVVLDIGANIGYYTLIAARLVGKSGKVYAFEPDPTNFSFLKRNVKINNYENVICEQKAVSNENGKAKLSFPSKFHPGVGTIVGEGKNYIEVETIKLDDYFNKDKNSKADLIKMDIGGAEALAFEGMQEIVRKNKEIKIFSEIVPKIMERSGINAEDYLNMLTNSGFKIYEIIEEKEKPNLKLINPSQFNEFIKKTNLTDIFCTRENKNVN